jgi:protein ImuB
MPAPAEQRVPAEQPVLREVPPIPPERRVVALVLPSLLIELAEPGFASPSKNLEDRTGAVPCRRLPTAVVLERESAALEAAEAVAATSVLSAVNDVARRLGVREGQTVAEARVFASRLVVRSVAEERLAQGLGRIAEIALGFGSVVAFSAPDTVWVDVTGIAHLFGGEAGLAVELSGRVREAGHRVRTAIADGPLLAQAFARFGEVGEEGFCLVPSPQTRQKLGRLPLRALNLPIELETWFIRLGIFTVSDLSALPRNALSARLGDHAKKVLELVEGRDPTPLERYEPPRTLIEETHWEEPVDGREPLLFVLRGLVARLSARLRGRGEAAQSLVLRIFADPAVARFRNVPRETKLELALPKPLHREDELGRILSSRLERLTLGAPSIGVRLEVPKLTEALPRQLELGALLMGARSDAADELPIVLAELEADLGPERVGVLKKLDSHRPEHTSQLVPALKTDAGKAFAKKANGKRHSATRNADKSARKKSRAPLELATTSSAGLPPMLGRVTRLLPTPVPFEAPLRTGASVLFDHRLYTIDSVHFEHRLEAVEWWTGPVHRDYVRIVLRGADSAFEALTYIDRDTGQRYLQGIFD